MKHRVLLLMMILMMLLPMTNVSAVSEELLPGKEYLVTGGLDLEIPVGIAFDPLADVTVQDAKGNEMTIAVYPEFIDTNQAGTYELFYVWKDENGVESGFNRFITVYEQTNENARFVKRLAGKDRYETAVLISQETYPSGASTVIVANGQRGVVDALAASPLAHKLQGPILLTNGTTLTDETKAELKRLQPAQIVIVGGESSVSSSLIENRSELETIRLAGVNRYETALAIANAVNPTAEKYIVASGVNPIDALAASSVAIKENRPIVLADANQQAIPEVAKDLLVVGGTASVPDKALQGYEGKVLRISGENRYETALKLAKYLEYDLTRGFIVANAGKGQVDALAASSLVSKYKMPILLTDGMFLSGVPETVERAFVVGGENSVSENVYNQLYYAASVSRLLNLDEQRLNLEFLKFVNAERMNYGIKPMRVSTEFEQPANLRAKEIVQKFEHTRPDGSNFSTALDFTTLRSAGENILYGSFPLMEGFVENGEEMVAYFMFDLWKNSPGHYDNFMNPDYNENYVGISVEEGEYFYTIYGVQLLGQRQ